MKNTLTPPQYVAEVNRRLAEIPGCTGRIELYLPSGDGSRANGVQYVGPENWHGRNAVIEQQVMDQFDVVP